MLWLAVTTLAMQALTSQASTTPAEVRVSSHPYVPQSPYTLKIDTKLVEIEAVVRDKHGNPVPGLTKEDFSVLDNGTARPITNFEVETTPDAATAARSVPAAAPGDAPASAPVARVAARPLRYLALFIDDVNEKDEAFANDLKKTQAAAAKFLQEVSMTDVRIGVFTVSGTATMDFTRDKAALLEAVAAVKPHMKMREGGPNDCPRITPYLALRIVHDHDRSALQAVVYDAGQKNCPTPPSAVFTMAEETLAREHDISVDTLNSIGRVVDRLEGMPGEREMLMASSGFVSVLGEAQQDQIVNRALRAGVVISALDSKGLYSEALPGSRPQDAKGYDLSNPVARRAYDRWANFETAELPMKLQTLNEPVMTLTDGTGGEFYESNNDLAAGFRKLAEPPKIRYRFSFRPENIAADGSYHKLKVSLVHSKEHNSVGARPGYFAPSKDAPDETLQAKVDREILANDTLEGFPMSISARKGPSTISVTVGVDISKLRFRKLGDRQVSRIIFTTALFDAQGKMAAAKEGIMDLALTDSTYGRIASTGLKAVLTLPAPPGVYKLRQVTGEAEGGKLACSTHTIELK